MVPHKYNTVSRVDAAMGRTACGLVLVAPFVFVPGLDDFANLPQMALIQAGACVLILLLFVKSLITRQIRFRISSLSVAVPAYIAWAACSLLWARNPHESLIPLLHLISCGVLYGVLAQLLRDPAWAGRLLTAMVFAGAGISLLGCLQHVARIDWVPQLAPPSATLMNRNFAMHVVAMTFPPMLAFALSQSGRWLPMVSGLSAVLAATYATYTSARAAWVAGVVAVLLLCAMLIREQRLAEPAVLLNRGKAVKAGLGILAVAVAMNLSPDGFQLRTKRIAQEAASVVAAKGDPLQHGGGRPAIWANTLAMIRDTPALGVGLANFWVFYPLYHKAVGEDRGVTESKVRLHAHNDYLQHGAELGVPGAALFLALLVLALWSNHRVLSTSPSPHDRLLSIAVLGGILGFMIEAVFTFPMERAIPPSTSSSSSPSRTHLRTGGGKSPKGYLPCPEPPVLSPAWS